MSRIIAAALCALVVSPLAAPADEAQTLQEIRELKQLIEQQMKRIDELTVEVGRLHQAVEAHRAAIAPGPEPKHAVVGPPPFAGFSELKPAPTRSAPAKSEPAKSETPAASEEPAPEAPKAEAVAGIKHPVAKGETLTSIAKRYNVTLGDLQKANKDVNDRKLQIGRVLIVPAAKPPETTPTENKEPQ